MKIKSKKTQNLLIEIGTEELPSFRLYDISLSFKQNMQNHLIKEKISFSMIKNFVTSRRLSLIIKDLPIKQKPLTKSYKGPKINIAFKNDKTLTVIGKKFITIHNIKKQDLKEENGKLFFKKTIHGKFISQIIISIIEKSIADIKLTNAMKWHNNTTAFIRPIHWYIVCLNNKTIKHSFFNINSKNFTYGHKLISQKIKNITSENYELKLEKIGYVIADFHKRKNTIISLIINVIKNLKKNIIIYSSLLNEITGLIEYPSVLIGTFKKSYLKLPKEILLSILLKYNKCFPLTHKNKLTNNFAIIIDTFQKKNTHITKWYNYAINARLSDITHLYYKEQFTFSLYKHSDLKNIIFQKQLGTIYDKTKRIKNLSSKISFILNENINNLNKTASLIKKDLLTKIVTEMPELEGRITSFYCKKETCQIRKNLYEYNNLINTYNLTPTSKTGIILSIADKLDTVCGFFFIKKEPNKNKDPYALRKTTIIILKTIIKYLVFINIKTLINYSLCEYNYNNTLLINKIKKFFLIRLKSLNKYIPIKYFNIINNKNNIVFTHLIVNIMNKFFAYKNTKNLIISAKRIYNIITKNSINKVYFINKNFFNIKEELILFNKLNTQIFITKLLYQKNLYYEIFKNLLELNKHINTFFNKIMILDKNIAKRQNRLILLTMILKHLSIIANIHLL